MKAFMSVFLMLCLIAAPGCGLVGDFGRNGISISSCPDSIRVVPSAGYIEFDIYRGSMDTTVAAGTFWIRRYTDRILIEFIPKDTVVRLRELR